MSIQPKTFTLHPGYRGFLVGIVNSDFQQRAFIEVTRDSHSILSATFHGQGPRVHMSNMFTNRKTLSFGPFNFPVTVHVTISSHHGGGSWEISKTVGPLAIEKRPQPDYPIELLVATVISEARQEASHDDCTITIFQYK
ncbi:hypothetical protein BV22DRAFT_535600 [Leucogyrophana mollusca]|uniref:Uncharacterized protein n=1 Tax=Leucogyrophana mollusca TaxID=85980 RepID=A0ACB8BEJ1_9AGAM|nr:hypothetical protein BV22DRAFT_535600 [Leucogyrophana mollusca]